MKINEVEKQTGISKQNIRFYEKKGLLNVKRNQENDYREYSEEDVETLKMIKVYRYLEFSIEDIRELLLAEPEQIRQALSDKDKRFYDNGKYLQDKRDIIKYMQKELDSTKKGKERESNLPDDLWEMIDVTEQMREGDIGDWLYRWPGTSLAAQIAYTIIWLGPVLWLFLNYSAENWDALKYNIPIAMVGTVLLTLSWVQYVWHRKNNPYKKSNKGTGLTFVGLLVALVLAFLAFWGIGQLQIKCLAPDNWYFYSFRQPYSSFVFLFEIEIVYGLIYVATKGNPHPDYEDSYMWIRFAAKHKWLVALLNLLLLYCCVTGVTFVTDSEVVSYSPFHPTGTVCTYAEIEETKMGYWPKRFDLNWDKELGDFYYKMKVKGKWVDISVPDVNEEIERYYEDSYLELEEFDQALVKLGVPKTVDEDTLKCAEKNTLDQEYRERFARMIHNR